MHSLTPPIPAPVLFILYSHRMPGAVYPSPFAHRTHTHTHFFPSLSPSNAQAPCQKENPKSTCVSYSSFSVSVSDPRVYHVKLSRDIPRQPQKERLRRKLQRPDPHLLNPAFPHSAVVQHVAGKSVVHLFQSSVHFLKIHVYMCVKTLPLSTPPPSARCRTASTSRQSRRPA
jgi:hypothetical protein